VVHARDVRDRIWSDVDARFGAFISAHLNPGARERDAKQTTYSRDLLDHASEVGLWAYALPEHVGGGGSDPLRFGLALERLGYLSDDAAFILLFALRTMIASSLDDPARPDLIDRYVRPAARGEIFLAFSYTEDADPFAFRSRAKREPDGSWRIDGDKRPVIGGETADAILTYVGGEDGEMRAFIVERSDPGVVLVPLDVGALRSGGTCRLSLEAVKIPPERVLAASDGLSHAQRVLNARRLLMVCPALGILQRLFERTAQVALQTIRYGEAITEMQIVQATFGRLWISLEACRAIAYEALTGLERGDPHYDRLSSGAKHFIARQAQEFVLDAYRPLATHGFIDADFARYQRDLAMLITISGTLDSIECALGISAVQEIERRERSVRKGG
jgi:alkylation response protein AidB-like acyl-CoA dehydrogenase